MVQTLHCMTLIFFFFQRSRKTLIALPEKKDYIEIKIHDISV